MSPRVPPSLALLALVISLAVRAASAYDNDWDDPLLEDCPSGHLISTIPNLLTQALLLPLVTRPAMSTTLSS